MTKQQFFEGVKFRVPLDDGLYYFEKLSVDSSGIISDNAGNYLGSIEHVTPQGVRVFTYFLGKRVSKFLFFRELRPESAKDLAV